MYRWMAVGLGGAIGSIARYAVNRLVAQQWPLLQFPLATMIVNLAGSVVVGALAGLATSGDIPTRGAWRDFLFVGIVGGFTTFSAFSLDTITLVRGGSPLSACLNVIVQVAGGIAGVYAGLVLFERR